jgi:hypothetical protein
MVLSELARGIAEALEQAPDGRIELAHAHGCAGETDLAQSGPDDVLASEKRGAAGRARLLPLVLKQTNSFFADAVDVRRFVAHHATAIGADVSEADVVAPEDEDIRFLGLTLRKGRCG